MLFFFLITWTQRRHSTRTILQKLKRNISNDPINIDLESNDKGTNENVIERKTSDNKEVIIAQEKKGLTGGI